MWYKHFLRNVRRDVRLSMSALATVARNRSDGKFTAKIDFRSGILCNHCTTDPDHVSLKSLHTLFGKYLDDTLVKFKQNHSVQTIQNVDFLTKSASQSVDPIFFGKYSSD